MGYTISVPAKTKELQQKMYAFLVEHFRGIDEIPDSGFACGTLRLATNTGDAYGLSYAPDDKGPLVGFDYSAICIEERYYGYALVYWISTKLTPAPHHYYYDDELFSVPKHTREEDIAFICPHPHAQALLGIDPDKIIDYTVKEINRLNNLWED